MSRRASRLAACLSAALLAAPAARAAEICRYAGTTSYSGTVAVQTTAAVRDGVLTLDITARLHAVYLHSFDYEYLRQEISTWRDRQLLSVAVNDRYSFAGSIIHEIWDRFTAGPEGLLGYRLQAKRPAELQAEHPRFAANWPLSSFGHDWLADYAISGPDRRPDLDLPRSLLTPDTGTPLAMAFYWLRWAPAEPARVPIILPGFKQDKRAEVQVLPAATAPDGAREIKGLVQHPRLSAAEPSTGVAWISPDHHFLRGSFDAHGHLGSAHGEVVAQGCTGTAESP